jgi:hypothetical protein
MAHDPDLSSLLVTAAMDQFLSPKAFGESFESVRELTDTARKAKAIRLPVEAGTRVMFTGGLGAYLGYDDAPAGGTLGTVISVKSATGNITAHDGRVFVEWDSGGARSIHADHLRLAPTTKQAGRDRFQDMDGHSFDVGSKVEYWPRGEFGGSGTIVGVDGKMVLFGTPGGRNPAAVSPKEIRVAHGGRSASDTSTFRVASLGDLTDFLKLANNALIQKSTRDLWSLKQDASGFVIERLFDDAGDPLKG